MKGNVLTVRVEEYLEAVLNMIIDGKPVLAARLAERLELAPPTVAATLRRMKRDGLILIGPHKNIGLTPAGRKAATTVVRRHRLAECLLADVLDVPWQDVHEEACLIEHGLSAMVEEKLYEKLGRPETCPHGNPIPKGIDIQAVRGTPLDTIARGTDIVVERIAEESARNADFMKFLADNGIMPGAKFTIKDVTAYAGTITICTAEKVVTLGMNTANSIWVSVVPPPSQTGIR